MMAIKIQTKKPEIPVEIGDLKFVFDVSDESIKNFREKAKNAIEAIEKIEVDEKDENKALDSIKDILRQGFDFMLGDGAFEKIYELSPSVLCCMQYFQQVVDGIEEELRAMGFVESQAEKAKKYLQAKKK